MKTHDLPLHTPSPGNLTVDVLSHNGDGSLVRTLWSALGGNAIAALQAQQATGGAVFATKAEADSKLGYAANTKAEVVDDPTEALNGIYQKQGASGTGSWLKIADLGIVGLEERMDDVETDFAQIETEVPEPARSSLVRWSEAPTVAIDDNGRQAALDGSGDMDIVALLESGDVKDAAGATLFDAGVQTITAVLPGKRVPRIVWNKAAVAARTSGKLIQDCVIPDDPRLCFLLISYGQSKSNGAFSWPAVMYQRAVSPNILTFRAAGGSTDPFLGRERLAGEAYDALTAAELSGFTPYTPAEVGIYGQPPIALVAALMSSWIERECGFAPRIVIASMGVGSGPTSILDNGDSDGAGNEPFADVVTLLGGFADLCTRYGWTPYCPFIHWDQGEADGATSDQLTRIQSIFSNLKTAVTDELGQVAEPDIYAGQPSVAQSGGGYAMRALQAAHVAVDCTVVGPQFWHGSSPAAFGYYSDGIHLTAGANVHEATAIWQAIRKQTFGAGREEPLRPTAITKISGTVRDVTMSEEFALNSNYSADLYGVRFVDPGNTVPATDSVTQTGTTTLRLTLASSYGPDGHVDIGIPETITGDALSGGYSKYAHGVWATRTRPAELVTRVWDSALPIPALHSRI